MTDVAALIREHAPRYVATGRNIFGIETAWAGTAWSCACGQPLEADAEDWPEHFANVLAAVDIERSLAGDTPWDDAVRRLADRRAASDRALAPQIATLRARIAVRSKANGGGRVRILVSAIHMLTLLDALDPETRP